MSFICKTSAIFNCYYAAISSIEIAARYDTCFRIIKYKTINLKFINNIRDNKRKNMSL